MEETPVFLKNMNERIFGMIHVPDKTPAPAVVFCHGFTGHKIEAHRLFVHAARKMCKEGFAVLRFDFRGSGESEGEFEDITVSLEISDLHAVLSFMKNRKDVVGDMIGVVGLSLGGAVSILTAAQNQTLRAVCTWSAPADFKSLSNIEGSTGMGQKETLEKGYIDLPSGHRLKKDFFTDVLKHDIQDSCAKISPRPFLIVHGSNDPVVPVQHANMLYERAGEPKKLVIIDDADHTFNRRDWEDKVIELTTGWFREIF